MVIVVAIASVEAIKEVGKRMKNDTQIAVQSVVLSWIVVVGASLNKWMRYQMLHPWTFLKENTWRAIEVTWTKIASFARKVVCRLARHCWLHCS